MPRQKARRVS
jgi:hypothetical protein